MNNPNINYSNFRPDINGLRALAVAAVIFYHFGIPAFDGGFSGVDIFFVISGFLMTGIIFTGLDRQEKQVHKFSILKFYVARARRILPALIALCCALLLLGFFFLAMPDYSSLGMHALTSLIFLSNAKFFMEAGYFDSASHEKWLLHTWSLSTEWQFYIVLPLVLVAIWKIRPGRTPMIIFLTAGFFASLFISIYTTPIKPSFAFYLLPARAWEMLAGGLIYFLQANLLLTIKQRFYIEKIGFSIIIFTLFFFNSSFQWPGWLALFPVIGTSMVLLAARSDSPLTNTFIAQWLGNRSYSLYLWHWPVVVMLTYLNQNHNPTAIFLGLILTLILSCLSYELIESPMRVILSKNNIKFSILILSFLTAIISSAGFFIWHNKGLAGRFSNSTDIAALEASNKNPRQLECTLVKGTESPNCIFGGPKVRAIMLGDSHADATITALASALPSSQDGVMALTYMGCPTLFGIKRLSDQVGIECSDFMESVMLKLDALPKEIPLVIVNRTSIYAFGFNEPWENEVNRPLVYFTKPHNYPDNEFLREFSKNLVDSTCRLSKNRTVYLVRPIPEMGLDIPKSMSRAMILGEHPNPSISLTDYHQRHKLIWAAQDAAREQCGAKILDPLPYLCRDGRCYATSNGRPLYFDDDHLSEFGNKFLTPMFKEVFSQNSKEKLGSPN